MPIKYAVVHRSDPNNVGDLAANPLQYFLNKDEYQVIDESCQTCTPFHKNAQLT